MPSRRALSLLDLVGLPGGAQALVPDDIAAKLEGLGVLEYSSTTSEGAYIHYGTIQALEDALPQLNQGWIVRAPGLTSGIPFQVTIKRARPSATQNIEPAPLAYHIDLFIDRVEIELPLMLDTIDALRSAAGPRIAVFSPSAGPGRTLRLASTSVVVDDVYALTGTTHLSRRGLSFDSSFAAAIFDEILDGGRPLEVRQFRRTLLAERLGLTPSLVPDDPADLVAAIKRVVKRGSGRVAPFSLSPADLPVTDADKDAWNRDGATIPTDFDLLGWLGLLSADVRSEVEEAANPPAP